MEPIDISSTDSDSDSWDIENYRAYRALNDMDESALGDSASSADARVLPSWASSSSTGVTGPSSRVTQKAPSHKRELQFARNSINLNNRAHGQIQIHPSSSDNVRISNSPMVRDDNSQHGSRNESARRALPPYMQASGPSARPGIPINSADSRQFRETHGYDSHSLRPNPMFGKSDMNDHPDRGWDDEVMMYGNGSSHRNPFPIIQLANPTDPLNRSGVVEERGVDERVVHQALLKFSSDFYVMASSAQDAERKNKDKRYFTWTPMMDSVLSDAFLIQKNEGNRLDGKFAWKPAAWTFAIEAMKKELNINVTKGNIQSRLKTWEKHFDIVSKMLAQSGFSWDYLKGRVDVSKSVWNEYVKAHPTAVPYRPRIIIDNWNNICELFAQDRVNGEGAQTAAETEIEMEVNNEAINCEEIIGTTKGDEMGVEDDTAHLPRQRSNASFSSASLSHSKKRKHSGFGSLYEVLSRMAESLDRYVKMEASKATTQMVLGELSKIEGLDRTMLLKAVDVFMNDQRKFETLVGLPSELNKHYVLLQLGLV